MEKKKIMSEPPPNKILKMADLQRSFLRVRQNYMESEPGETTLASDNAQEMTSLSIKTEVKEGPSKDVKQKLKEETRTFRFRIRNGMENIISCDIFKTVFGALNTHEIFQRYDKKNKEIIIQRFNGKIPGEVVKTDFPCCLIENGELLQINLYKNEDTSCTNQETTTDSDPRNLINFYIKTRGKKIKKIMKSSALEEFGCVCVFAHRGENLKEALQQDDRFIDEIFDNDCELIDTENRYYRMNLAVDCCEGKTFMLKVDRIGKKTKPSSKKEGVSLHQSLQPYKTHQKTTGKMDLPTDPSTTEGHGAPNSVGSSGQSFSTHIEKILRPLLKNVLKMLEVQENPQVQKFFQEDYDKGIQCFTEVKKVRKIMDLSDSVCLIQAEDSGKGTGFLAFDRFILTNAHVIHDYVYFPPEQPHTLKLSRPLRAVFNYEGWGSEPKCLSVKDEIVAYGLNKDDRLRVHDFALLELEAPPENCTELFDRYVHAPHPKRGGIYIVGHPACEVKKMDPCFIIEPEKQPESINKHLSENLSCPLVSWHCWPYLYQNQITYDTCMFHGSSGSPVFDEHCYLIGMHSGGFDYKEGERTRSVIEFAYSMQSIVEAIVSQVRTRDEILKLLCKFKSIAKHFNLKEIQDTCRTNIPLMEELQSDDDEEMEVQ